MSLLDRTVAALYDPVLRRSELGWLGRARRELLRAARGVVLELGAGTGANLDHLDVLAPAVTRWIAAEPTAPMLDRLHRRVEVVGGAHAIDVEVLRAPAEALPLPDGSVDTVVSTLVLCTVGDLDRTLAEVRRVLRPGGQLLVLEHVAATGTALRAQRVAAPAWRILGRGCNLDRDTVAALDDAGFLDVTVTELEDGPSRTILPIVTGALAPS
jgi:ubiquinone/menaquinone biosynthesis C-methylase UbiE